MIQTKILEKPKKKVLDAFFLENGNYQAPHSADHLKGLRALVQDHPRIGQRIVVCLERKSRRTEDGILILPSAGFCERLKAGDLF